MTRRTNFSLAAALMVVALVVSAFIAPVSAQSGGSLGNCDSAVQALVWAAEDAYGYDWQAQWAAGFPGAGGSMTSGTDMDMDNGNDNSDDSGDDDGDNDNEATPEATETAKLLTAKVPAFVAQDATEEPGDDNSNDNTADTGATAPALNCDQLRADVVSFIFGQNGMEMAMTQPMFTVDGTDMVGEYAVQLSGPQEVPGPGDDDGTGSGWVNVDEANNAVCWAITLSGIDFPAAAAHIHVGALGEAGPVVVPLTAPVDGNWVGCTEADAQAVADITANPSGFYVNVHTTPFPNGAVRGQLLGS